MIVYKCKQLSKSDTSSLHQSRSVRQCLFNKMLGWDSQRNSHHQEVQEPAPETVHPGCLSDQQSSAVGPETCPTWCSVSVHWWWVCWMTSQPLLQLRHASCIEQMHTVGALRLSGSGFHHTGRSNLCTSQRTCAVKKLADFGDLLTKRISITAFVTYAQS